MKRSVKSVLIVVFMLTVGLVVIAGCARAPAPAAPTPIPAPARTMEQVVVKEAAVEKAAVAGAPDVLAGVSAERMIIRTGNLALVVEDTAAAMQRIKSIVEELDGYVASSNAYHDGEQLRGTMTVRVPATQFDQALERFKSLAVRVQNESTGGQDVTEEYTDLSARLRNLEATEKELLELLTSVRQRTGKAEDILAVYRELTNIRAQIEQLKGRMQYLERMTALATIEIQLIPYELQKPIVEPAWNPSVTWRNATRALVDAFRFIVDALIWIIVVALPILIIIGLPIFVVVWLIRRLVRRKKPSA